MLVESGMPVPQQAWRVINLVFIAPLVESWESNAPQPGSRLREWIEPAYAAAVALDQTSTESSPFLDYIELVKAAREEVQHEDVSGKNGTQGDSITDGITVGSVLKDIELDVKLAVLVARLGHHGIRTLIDHRRAAAGRAATRGEKGPPPQLDLLSLDSVEQPSYRTMSHAEIQSMADPGVMTSEEYLAGDELAYRAPIMKYFASLWVTYATTQWDELYRPQLAELFNCDRGDVVSELFADLNKFRQDYVHNRGIATSRSSKNKRLNWFARGAVMIPTPENYDQLLQELDRELPLLAQPPAPKERPNRAPVKAEVPAELVRRFEKAADAIGLGASAALEAALAEWIRQHDGRAGTRT